MKMASFKKHKSVITKCLMAVLLFMAFDVAYFSAHVTDFATTTECDSEGFKDLLEDIGNEDAGFEKAHFACKPPIKTPLPTPSFLLVSEPTDQVWQPPKF